MFNFGFENVSEVGKIIGYSFKSKPLLVQAFTRRSFGVESGAYTDNEVLEFVGDRAVDYDFILKKMNTYDKFLAGQDNDVHKVGEYHVALQKELCRQMEVSGYVIVYPGCGCDVIARPVIFKLGE